MTTDYCLGMTDKNGRQTWSCFIITNRACICFCLFVKNILLCGKNTSSDMALFSYLHCRFVVFVILFKQVWANKAFKICDLWTFSSSMPPRGQVLTSVSARRWPGELSMSLTVLVSASYQDSSYFSIDRVWMHTDWWEFDISFMLFSYKNIDCSTDAIIARGLIYILQIVSICLFIKIWLCQNLVKLNSQFVKLLVGPQRQTCMFQIKRILGFCCRYST